MRNTSEAHAHRAAWWVLRYKSGDVFAISNLPEEQRWTEDDGICQILDWAAPLAFKKMIDAGEVTIMWYDHEPISQVEFDTYSAFGLPLVDTINDKGMPVLPCDATK